MLSMMFKQPGSQREYGAGKALSDNPMDTAQAREKKKKKKMQNRTGVPSAMDVAAVASRGFGYGI